MLRLVTFTERTSPRTKTTLMAWMGIILYGLCRKMDCSPSKYVPAPLAPRPMLRSMSSTEWMVVSVYTVVLYGPEKTGKSECRGVFCAHLSLKCRDTGLRKSGPRYDADDPALRWSTDSSCGFCSTSMATAPAPCVGSPEVPRSYSAMSDATTMAFLPRPTSAYLQAFFRAYTPPRHACLNSGTSTLRDKRPLPSLYNAASTMPFTMTAPAELSVELSVPSPMKPTSCGLMSCVSTRFNTALAAIVYAFSFGPVTRKLLPTTFSTLSHLLPVHSHQSCRSTLKRGTYTLVPLIPTFSASLTEVTRNIVALAALFLCGASAQRSMKYRYCS
eukprot:Rhum_TRINITY_DN14863_c3_g1::Rhum_TRINITY_DN14863_c3_g1_i2::g.123634::m.123634